jgi:hypothetical protein
MRAEGKDSSGTTGTASTPGSAARRASSALSSIKLPLKDKITLLRLAVRNGDDQQAQNLMVQLKDDGMLESAGFTTQDAAGNGLLQIAALYGHTKVAELLLMKGFNINSVDRNHGTALQAAIYMGRDNIIDYLLKRGKPDIDPKHRLEVNTKGGYYGCALQVAAYRAKSELVKKLVDEYEADVNVPGGKYGYPLQAAVRTGHRAVVGKMKWFLEFFASILSPMRLCLPLNCSKSPIKRVLFAQFHQNRFELGQC